MTKPSSLYMVVDQDRRHYWRGGLLAPVDGLPHSTGDQV